MANSIAAFSKLWQKFSHWAKAWKANCEIAAAWALVLLVYIAHETIANEKQAKDKHCESVVRTENRKEKSK